MALAEDYFWIIIWIAIGLHFDGNLFAYTCSVIGIGSRQRALATLLHEASHYTLAKNRLINEVIGKYFSGYLILQTFALYRLSHIIKGHHRNFGDVNNDPDYQFHKDVGLYQENLTPLIVAKAFFKYYFYLLKNRIFQKGVKLDEIASVITIHTLLFLLFGVNYLHYWIIPLVTSFAVIGFFIEMAEHWPLMRNTDDLYRTRNRNSGIVEKFLCGMHNESFHLVHHLYPRVPFWKLMDADKYLESAWPEYKLWNDSQFGILSNQRGSIIHKVMNYDKH